MKKLMAIVLLFSIFGFQNPDVLFRINPSYSDKKLREIEDSLKSKYYILAKITVLKRDAEGNIKHIKYEGGGAGCESDNFGLLSIRSGGCGISDKIR
jgi:hypothetical protein